MNKINIINVILTIIAILCMFIVIFCDNHTVCVSVISFQFIIIFVQICMSINIIRKRNDKNLESKKV